MKKMITLPVYELEFPDIEIGEEAIAAAIRIIADYGQIDGAHHKMWVLDQVLRLLTGEKYDDFITFINTDFETGEIVDEWDTGIAP